MDLEFSREEVVPIRSACAIMFHYPSRETPPPLDSNYYEGCTETETNAANF
jgi:hypothetical protein